jgi:hypothetical protein
MMIVGFGDGAWSYAYALDGPLNALDRAGLKVPFASLDDPMIRRTTQAWRAKEG